MTESTPSDGLPILYVKTGCPWCDQAIEILDERGVGYQLRNVSDDRAQFSEMKRKSGQDKAPVLDWHGRILADFGPDELYPFLRAQNVKLEDS
ncbi:MAG TPA: glutaredoxin family protein [Candidatus Synoicihabitans sp.]|nr:glutaredoxin family protein [Candidatus Synoicihabitans sp.]